MVNSWSELERIMGMRNIPVRHWLQKHRSFVLGKDSDLEED